MIRRLDHAQIMIPPGGEAAARRFYCELLGLVEIEKPRALRARGGFWLTVGEQQIHVGVDEAARGLAPSRAHLGLEVEQGTLSAARERLAAGGVAIVDGTQPAGFRRFEIRDPAGNRLELLEKISPP